MSKRVLIDMDNILVDTLPAWLEGIYQATGIKGGIEDVIDWDFQKCPKFASCTQEQIYRSLNTPGWFLNLKPMENAPEVIRSLINEGFDINIVSTPFNPQSAKEKMEWLNIWIPEIPFSNIFLASKKEYVFGDVLIDDKPSTLNLYGQNWPKSKVLGIKYPYNNKVNADLVTYSNSAWTNLYYKIKAP